MAIPVLSPSDFPAYFRATHGVDPFPWQARLLSEVLEHGWSRPISVPTASGKTAVLDVAVFALACQADRPAEQRTTPRRIALVVDRRIVVDGAFERAERIREAVVENVGNHPILSAVRERLLALGGESPLDTALLRGGIYREDRWARSPAQPVILCSTVDQIGSRLLFRGYGLSNHVWPIHAGLLGNDTLIVLDEAHCSRPFLQTLAWVDQYRRVAEQPVTTPFAAIPMTATLAGGLEPFRLDDLDHAHPVLKARLNATKPIALATCGKQDDDLVQSAMEHLLPTLTTGTTALVVVNRVAAARGLFRRLHERAQARKDRLDADVILLTGRSRSVERDALIRSHWERIRAGRDRVATATTRPMIVVATQCVEVGADLDVDVLISECCPLDALRQRLGRLDRLGMLGATGRTAAATVLCRTPMAWDGAGDPPDDPIYGTALARTWHWLNIQGAGLDGGISLLDARLPSAAEMALLVAPPVDAPVMFPAYCDLWAQTGPVPAVSPDPTMFLHGPRQGEPEVQVVWRADLGTESTRWAAVVAACPPVSGESISLPLSAVRRWLAGDAPTADAADTPMPPGDDPDSTTFAQALRWRGPDDSFVAKVSDDIRPGDVLVVPASYGGCDAFGWDPGPIPAPVATTDVADLARATARRAPVLRLHPAVAEGLAPALVELARIVPEPDPPDDVDDRVQAALAGSALAEAFGTHPEILVHPSGVGIIVIAAAGWAERARDFTDEDDSSSRAPQPLSLIQHLGEVETQARIFAHATGMPATLVADLALAGRLHDLGKADPRFQAWLQGGDSLRARRSEPLAKSVRMRTGAAMAAARERSGYPQGGRHELLSVRMAESADPMLAAAHDRDLVLHLVASHHGRCRPFAPVVIDERPLPVRWSLDGIGMQASSATCLERLDSGIPERFWRLTRRYGWWGLAWLEACLRLADHRASEQAEHRKAP